MDLSIDEAAALMGKTARQVAATPDVGQFDVLIRAAQGYYRAGQVDEALEAYDRARKAAEESSRDEQAFQAGFAAAAIAHLPHEIGEGSFRRLENHDLVRRALDRHTVLEEKVLHQRDRLPDLVERLSASRQDDGSTRLHRECPGAAARHLLCQGTSKRSSTRTLPSTAEALT